MFLILRCKASDALEQTKVLRRDCELLGLRQQDIRCPSHVIVKRMGRERARVEVEVPLLGSFLFIKWDGNLYFANYLEYNYHYLKVMRLPYGGYATCTEEEVAAIRELEEEIAPAPEPHIERPLFEVGDPVEVARGFLRGVTGKVLRNKTTGEVVMKVLDSKGWKLSTLLIHYSVLMSPRASI